MNSDGLISAHSTWTSRSQTQLTDIITTKQETRDEFRSEADASDRCESVCLERAEEDSPCVITLLCSSNSAVLISSLQVISEARTIEVYSLSGDYCGTCRGEELQKHSVSSEEMGPFYRSCLVLESPVASCEVKLLSLGGRSSVNISQVGVGLQALRDGPGGPSVDPGIDLQRVQAMMEDMGTTLSPGAQNLMELVQCQQKNKADMLSGFIPLLVGGGALSCLARGGGASRSARMDSDQHPPPVPGLPLSTSNQNQIPGAMSGLPSAETGPSNPDMLSVLQSVCGQVTQLRLDEATSAERKTNGEREGHICCGGFEKILERVVEKRMEEMERRLKEHLDVRLDALQQRLENTLQQALSHTPNHH